jgi:hypothetical protein
MGCANPIIGALHPLLHPTFQTFLKGLLDELLKGLLCRRSYDC